MKRDHMSLRPVRNEGPDAGLWACDACKATGSFEWFDTTDCPKGLAPRLRDLPKKIELAIEDRGAYTAHAVIHRDDDYKDDQFEAILKMRRDIAALRRLDVMRRLGALDRVWWTARSKIDGGCIGTIPDADSLIERGIAPQRSHPDAKVCSIGFCEKEQSWYGWSHRAMYGFTVGYVAKEGDCVTTTGKIESYIIDHPEEDRSVPVGFECKTLDDCKRCAIAFADSVG